MMPLTPLREAEIRRLAEDLAKREYPIAFRTLAEAEKQRDPYPSVVLRLALQIERDGQARDAMIALLERHIRKAEQSAMGGR